MSQANKKTVNRDFKGIWIPKEIWLFEGISNQEILLWAEIDSLYSEEYDGAFASNDYLMGFLGVKERRLQEMIQNLKSKGLLVQTGFNGRLRYLKAIHPNICKEASITAPQRCTKAHPRGAEKCTSRVQENAPLVLNPHILHENKVYNKVEEYPPSPAKALHCENVLLSPEENEKLTKLYGPEKLKEMIEILDDYIGSSGKKYKSHYHVLKPSGWVHNRYMEKRTSGTKFNNVKDRRTVDIAGNPVENPLKGRF